ncbi:MAG: porin [Cognatishimia sp.]|uniref:porin n=1 Tax=Cognatishimia sp. TaxID=2211648 RepID=UPI003B8C974B
MKKVLFASTALVMTAGVAAAEITITGEANMGLKHDGTDTTVHNEIDFNVVGTGETDGGLSFGASVDLDGSSDDSVTTVGTVSDAEVFVAYNGLTLTVGEIGEAADQGGLKDVGYDGIGIDNIAEITDGLGFGSHDVRVDYAFGDIKVAASVDSSNDDWAIGGSASFDAFSVALGFGEAADEQYTLVTLGYTSGAISANVFWNTDDGAADDGMGVDVSYTTGDVTVTAVYADAGAAGDGYGIGVAYDLGGATLAGGIGQNAADDTVADLGISFKF